jgi:TolB-like protein
MGSDEVGTLHAVKAVNSELIEPSISARRGRIVKTTGDGVLAEFPSAIDAVACAVAIQQGVKRRNDVEAAEQSLKFRIGINVGDIIIDQKDIFGDGVNIAARLETLSQPGGICISGTVREHVQGKLPLTFDDMGEQLVKNIVRPVHAYGMTSEAIAAAPDFARVAARRRWVSTRVAASLAILMVVISGATWLVESTVYSSKTGVQSEPAVGGRRASVAILPFGSSEVGTDGDYFSDGLTEDVISALGRFRELSVMSQGAVSAYKGKTPSPDQVGRELHVGYVVEGSVRRSSDRIRVSVRLTETVHNAVLWSDRFDVESMQIFAVQDQITRQLSGALAIRISNLETRVSSAKPPSNLQTYDLVLRGRNLLTTLTRTNNAEARRLFQRAIDLDSTYAPAYVGLGRVNRFAAIQGWTPDATEALGQAEQLARKAVALDDLNAGAHALLGLVLVQFGDYDQALNELNRATEINASDSVSFGGLCAVLLWRGDVQGAIRAGETLNQFQPELSAPDTFHLATAYVLADRAVDALRVIQQSLNRNPREPNTNIILAAAYAQAGRKGEAERQANVVRTRFPWFSRDEFGSLLRDNALREKLRHLLQEAGL